MAAAVGGGGAILRGWQAQGGGKPDGSMVRRARGAWADKSARAARAADAAAVAAVMLPKRKRAQQGAKLALV